MREYLEGYEQRLVEGMEGEGLAMVMVIRYEITGFDESEVQQSINDIEALLNSPYEIYEHICFHDEDPHKPCELKLVRQG